MDPLIDIFDGVVKVLDKCKHRFHTVCIDECFSKSNPQCPICKTLYGTPNGNQPAGTMKSDIIKYSVPGFPNCKDCIQIQYTFESGIQTEEHPNPGKAYSGTSRVAYLPNNAEGQQILKLLRLAFDHRLIFTIGTSVTTGRENTVVWNGIHHKTNLQGGPTSFGYPDEEYLNRVTEEMASVGITKELLESETTNVVKTK